MNATKVVKVAGMAGVAVAAVYLLILAVGFLRVYSGFEESAGIGRQREAEQCPQPDTVRYRLPQDNECRLLPPVRRVPVQPSAIP